MGGLGGEEGEGRGVFVVVGGMKRGFVGGEQWGLFGFEG